MSRRYPKERKRSCVCGGNRVLKGSRLSDGFKHEGFYCKKCRKDSYYVNDKFMGHVDLSEEEEE